LACLVRLRNVVGLALNDPIIRAYLSACRKNIIGKTGFELQSQLKNGDGGLAEEINDELEWQWYEWGKASKGDLTIDGGMGHKDFDALILNTLLVNGEVFIRVHHKGKFGIQFELIDSKVIDYTKYRESTPTQNGIVNGVEIDANYRPVAYWIRKGNTTTYLVGKEEKIPASEVIHIYKREFPEQTRGIPPFNAVLGDIKNLEEYKVAEITAAKVGACTAVFFERNTNPQYGDPLNDGGKGKTYVQPISPGTATYAPEGFNVKTLTPTHPNVNYASFQKAVLKPAASSLGISYAKLTKDYEAVNYSSLREGTLDEAAFYQEWQDFLIENWKEIEFELFIKTLILKTDIIKPRMIDALLRQHTWITQKRAYFDPAKDLVATERELKLGLKSPLAIIEEDGRDPDEVMKQWALYDNMCKKYGLSFNVRGEKEETINFEDQNFNDESIQQEQLNHARD